MTRELIFQDQNDVVQSREGTWSEFDVIAKSEPGKRTFWVDADLPVDGIEAFSPFKDLASSLQLALSRHLQPFLTADDAVAYQRVSQDKCHPTYLLRLTLLELDQLGKPVPLQVTLVVGYRTLITLHKPSAWFSSVVAKLKTGHQLLGDSKAVFNSVMIGVVGEADKSLTAIAASIPVGCQDSALLLTTEAQLQGYRDALAMLSSRMRSLETERDLGDPDHWSRLRPLIESVVAHVDESLKRIAIGLTRIHSATAVEQQERGLRSMSWSLWAALLLGVASFFGALLGSSEGTLRNLFLFGGWTLIVVAVTLTFAATRR